MLLGFPPRELVILTICMRPVRHQTNAWAVQRVTNFAQVTGVDSLYKLGAML